MQHTDPNSVATMHDGHFEITTVETRHPRRAAPPSPAGRNTYPPCNILPNRTALGLGRGPPPRVGTPSWMDSRMASQSGRQHSMIRCGHSVWKSHHRNSAMVVCCPSSVPRRLTCLSCHILAHEGNPLHPGAEVVVLDENRSRRQLPCVERLTTTTEDHEYKKS